jgi:hypothetical protein
MSKDYRYRLDKGSKKYICPICGEKTFVYYVDTHTGEYLPERYGKCDREDNCGHHLNPYKDGYAKEVWKQENGLSEGTPYQKPKTMPQKPPQPPKTAVKQPTCIPFEVYREMLAGYEQNGFIQNLIRLHGVSTEAISKVIELYYLGTYLRGYLKGAVSFPFISEHRQVQAVQVKAFDEQNHTKKPYGTNWLHTLIAKETEQAGEQLPEWLEAYQSAENRVQCLFGEHLLSTYPNSTVMLVEAPKTAIYGTLFFGFPDKHKPNSPIWLAVGAKGWINYDKAKALRGRTVVVFPDLSEKGNTFEEWKRKFLEYEQQLGRGTRIKVSDYFERIATPEQRKGDDLADFLVNENWQKWKEQQLPQPEPQPERIEQPPQLTYLDSLYFEAGTWYAGNGYPAAWDTIEGTPYITDAEREHLKEKIEQAKEARTITRTLPNEATTTEQPPQPTYTDIATEIEQLRRFFDSVELRGVIVELSRTEAIKDVPKFLTTHFEIVSNNRNERIYLPYLQRLRRLRDTISKHRETGA